MAEQLPTENDMGTTQDRPTTKPRADVDPIFEKQINELKDQAKEAAVEMPKGGIVKWMVPDKNGWDGDLFKVQDMELPFDRTQSNDWFSDAVKDPKSPGTTGDLVITTVQIDLLACQERAFRSRHTMRRPRAACHAAGRKFGHGHDKGPLVQCQLEYVRGLVKQSKDKTQ